MSLTMPRTSGAPRSWLAYVSFVMLLVTLVGVVIAYIRGDDGAMAALRVEQAANAARITTLNDRLNAQAARLSTLGDELAKARDRNDAVQGQINALALGTLQQITEATQELGDKAEASRTAGEARSRRVDEQLGALTSQVGIVVEQVRGLTNTVERLVAPRSDRQ